MEKFFKFSTMKLDRNMNHIMITSAYQDTKALNQLNTLIQDGKEMASMRALYLSQLCQSTSSGILTLVNFNLYIFLSVKQCSNILLFHFWLASMGSTLSLVTPKTLSTFSGTGPHWQAAFYDLLGQGILTSDGESWLIQRETTALGFTTRTLRQAMGHWVNRTIKNRLWCILDKASNEKKSVDFEDLGYGRGVTASEDQVQSDTLKNVAVSKAVATGLSSNSAESVCGHGLPLAQTNKHFLRRKCKTYWQIFTGLAKVIYIYVKHIGI
ncbi:hypothetical protein CXB51_006163 [Gossypium anomalum]|uniref:Uncharacterized protein n=1 Tax=Gossypium anomalum TaxID=47600 RepID=A0A8J6DCK6_9ROSI|nr:hypothetical protein CXB51_006163 [Gossypium anomalum]